jgi:hypothetical protein
MLKGACPFSTTSDTDPSDASCTAWNAAAEQAIVAMRPDSVLTLASLDVRVGLTEQTPQGFIDQWSNLNKAGIPVVAVRDNPRFGFSPPTCISANGAKASSCSLPRGRLLAATPPYEQVTGVPPNVSFLDFSDYYCGRTTCHPEVGNVLVYMDDNHVTATFMTTLSPILERGMTAALGW